MVSKRGRKRTSRLRQWSQKDVTSTTKRREAAHDENLKRSMSDPGISKEVVSSAQLLMLGTENGDLKNLYIIDDKTFQRILPNEMLHSIDNELLSGYMLAMVPKGDTDNYFDGKKRKIEMQFQVKFKKIPENQIYIGCELDEPLNIGICQRTFLRGILNVVERKNPNFHFSLNTTESMNAKSSKRECSNQSETSYLAMPFEKSLNALVVTKEGGLPPALGETLDMDRSHISIGDIDFNTSDTFTFSIWSGYVDLLKWKCSNIAPVQPLTLNSVLGRQAFHLNFYTCERVHGHARVGMKSFMSFEFGHETCKVGPSRKTWTIHKKASSDYRLHTREHVDDIRDDVDDGLGGFTYLGGCMCWSPYN